MSISDPGEQFTFRRARGIVWVADIANSTEALNDDRYVQSLEEYIPRLHWLASLVVKCAHGVFVKWTGDGFLAWFEMPLHRDLPNTASRVLKAAWYLTLASNITNLALTSDKGFRLRHGITYEQDALLTNIKRPDGGQSLEIIGRSVVLAFRASGVTAPFPNVVTQRELVEAIGVNDTRTAFKRWRVNSEDLLKHFKGEKWGTNNLYVSCERRARRTTAKRATQKARLVLDRIAQGETHNPFVSALVAEMQTGPAWAQATLKNWASFLHNDMLGAVKGAVEALDNEGLESV